jgi:hypothetical protein
MKFDKLNLKTELYALPHLVRRPCLLKTGTCQFIRRIKVENSNQSLHENEVWMSEYKGTGGDSTVQKSLPYPGEKSSGCCFQT